MQHFARSEFSSKLFLDFPTFCSLFVFATFYSLFEENIWVINNCATFQNIDSVFIFGNFSIIRNVFARCSLLSARCLKKIFWRCNLFILFWLFLHPFNQVLSDYLFIHSISFLVISPLLEWSFIPVLSDHSSSIQSITRSGYQAIDINYS